MLFLVFLPILSNGLLLVLDVFSFIFFYPVGSFYKTFLLDVDTLRLFSIFGFQGTDSFLWMFPSSGDGEIRTLDPLLARQVLSQLSYAPIPDGSLVWLFRKALFQVLFQVFSPPVGLSGLEPPTSRLSGVRSNRLSYKPIFPALRLSGLLATVAVPLLLRSSGASSDSPASLRRFPSLRFSAGQNRVLPVVEINGIEPLTSCLQSRRSSS